MVEPGDALQPQLAEAARELPALVARGGEEFLGEEGVAFGAVDDRVGQRRQQSGVGVRCEQRCHLLVLERSEFEHVRRA